MRTLERQEIAPFSAEDYLIQLDKLEAPRRRNDREAISTTESGPARLALSRFFPARGSNEAQLWIEATLADIPNIALLPQAFARIEVERVQRLDGSNIYAKSSPFETNFFKTLTLEKEETERAYSGVRSVRISGATRREDIAYVTGRLVLKLPLEMESFVFTQAQRGVRYTTAAEADVELLSLDGNEAVFRTTGRPEAYVTVYGYDSAGRRLALAQESVSADGLTAERKASFYGELEHIEAVFTRGYLTTRFPFVLKGPGARRMFPFGPQQEAPVESLIVGLRQPQRISPLL